MKIKMIEKMRKPMNVLLKDMHRELVLVVREKRFVERIWSFFVVG